VRSFLDREYKWLGSIRQVNKFPSLEVNSKNFIVSTELGRFVFKVWGEASKDRLNEIFQVLDHLHRCGIRVPVPIISTSGSRVSINNSNQVSIFRFIEGKTFEPKTRNFFDFLSASDNLFNALRRLEIGKNNHSAILIDSKSIWETIENALCDIDFWYNNSLESAFSRLSSISPFVKDNLQHFLRIYNSTHLQYSHYDLHPRNVLSINDFEYAFLDFESCQILNPNIAWGFMLLKNMREVVASNPLEVNIHALSLSSLSFIRNTDFGQYLDIENLPIYGRFEVSRRLAIILEQIRKHGSSRWLNMLPVQISLLWESLILFDKGT
jgi:hypothetical protein